MQRLFKSVALALCLAIGAGACAPLPPKNNLDSTVVLIKNPFPTGEHDRYLEDNSAAAYAPLTQPIPLEAKILKVIPPKNADGSDVIFYVRTGSAPNPAKECLAGEDCKGVANRLNAYQRVDISTLTFAEQNEAVVVPPHNVLTGQHGAKLVAFIRYTSERSIYEEGRDQVPSHPVRLDQLGDRTISWTTELLPYFAKNWSETFFLVSDGTGRVLAGAGSAARGFLSGLADLKNSERRTQLPDVSFDNSAIIGGNSSAEAEGGDAKAISNAEADAKAKADAEIKGPKKPGGCDHGDCDHETSSGRGGTRGIVSQPYTPK